MNPLVTLTVEKLVYGGYGLAFAHGRAYFILNALPGETVRAAITHQKKNTSFGKTVEIVVRSPLRVEAPCPHFMGCGGCHLQHLEYPDQVRFKEGVLRETFRRIGQLTLSEVDLICSPPWHYRTRAQFKVSKEKGKWSIGFYAAQSHRLWPVNRCPLLAERLNGVLEQIVRQREKFAASGVAVEEFQIRTNGEQSQWALDFIGPPPEFDWGEAQSSLSLDGQVHYRTPQGAFQCSTNSFFQVNRFMIDRLVNASVAGASGKRALDLYSGVGLFALALAPNFERVLAIEENPSALRDLRENLHLNQCSNIEVIGGPVEAILNWKKDRWQDVEFVLLDPPRSGVQKSVLHKITEHPVLQCVYVSCDPSSMARDLRVLSDRGYQMEKISLLDFFPQTYHFETVAYLKRSS